MILTILLTFGITTGGYLALVIWACRRVAEHLRGDEEAMTAFTKHVWMPLLGKGRPFPMSR